MEATTLAVTVNTPRFELRPAPTERILVIEHDGALRRILERLFCSEGYVVDVVLMPFVVWRDFVRKCPRQSSSIYRAQNLQGVIFARKLRI